MVKVKNDILEILGKNIKKLRNEQNISQGQLAFETGLTREYINRVESGNYNISVRKLNLIADALGVNIKRLFN